MKLSYTNPKQNATDQPAGTQQPLQHSAGLHVQTGLRTGERFIQKIRRWFGIKRSGSTGPKRRIQGRTRVS